METIYMAERANRTGYRKVPRNALTEQHIFEGADGDEEADTVTYWFRRRDEDDEA